MSDYDFELRITMKSIMMYENLAGKGFSMDVVNDPEQITIFMYCIFVCSTNIRVGYNVFCDMLEVKKFSRKFTRQFQELLGYLQQFNYAGKSKVEETQDNVESAATLSMTDYVNALIFSYGADVGYVLDEMELWMLEPFYKAAEEKMKSTMEDKRLWAYMQLLPNFDKKHKNITPEKFLPFPWEKNAHKKVAEKDLEVQTKVAKNILGMSLNELLGKKNIEDKPDNEEISKEN